MALQILGDILPVVRFEVFTAVTMKNGVLPVGLVDISASTSSSLADTEARTPSWPCRYCGTYFVNYTCFSTVCRDVLLGKVYLHSSHVFMA
jgi:hypothetical protein